MLSLLCRGGTLPPQSLKVPNLLIKIHPNKVFHMFINDASWMPSTIFQVTHFCSDTLSKVNMFALPPFKQPDNQFEYHHWKNVNFTSDQVGKFVGQFKWGEQDATLSPDLDSHSPKYQLLQKTIHKKRESKKRRGLTRIGNGRKLYKIFSSSFLEHS